MYRLATSGHSLTKLHVDSKTMPDKTDTDSLLNELAEKLRSHFQEVLEQPIPPEIVELLDKLTLEDDASTTDKTEK